MSVITVFNGIFCKEDAVIQEVVKKTGYELVRDKDLVAEAAEVSGMAESKIERVFSGKTSVFNKFTHEQERSVASLRLALAKRLTGDNFLIAGFVGQLIPKEVSHVLRVCLIADMKFRVSAAAERQGISEKDATRLIHRQDEDCIAWMNTLFQTVDPWDPSRYDMVIPTHKKSVEEAATLICDNIDKDVLKPTEASRRAVEDVLLAAKVEVALAKEGHNVNVSAKDGAVTLTINKQVLMLHRLEEELMSIAQKVEGVRSAETKVGKDYYQTDIYRKYDFEMPSKVLLVDDEREFVETLSERLIMRRMGSAVAYDGESALDLIKEDEPEVMILDLKMPGIDGIEVLRRVKATRPEIEVIILTGHGSEADRDVCMELGAFAYLNKPVDIDLLSDTLRRANEKIKEQKAPKS
ncbi:MAG: response regulator [Thermodesulfobacteriota bacterium]|nr:response regulator [Thermodesulfobacteriota bacterium]